MVRTNERGGPARRLGRRLGATGALVLLLAGVAAAPRTASAQQKTLYLDRLDMAGAPDDGVAIWRPQMGQKTRFFGQLGFGFALNPLRVQNEVDDPTKRALLQRSNGNPVTAQLQSYVDVGVEIFDRFAIQASLPFILYQAGNPTNRSDVGVSDSVSFSKSAVMDMRLDARAILFRSDDRAAKLGVRAGVWLPTGSALSYGSDRAAGGVLALAGEYDWKSFFLTLNTGVRFRPQVGVNDFAVSNEWTWGLGGFLPLRDGTIRIGAELFGSTGLGSVGGKNTTFDGKTTPLEWMLESRLALTQSRQLYAGLGAGTRMSNGYAPDFRAVAMLGGWFGVADTDPPSPAKKIVVDEPADQNRDTDHDGLPDDVDLCPTEPEDHKPPNPDDGCPAPPDRDGDGIPDAQDKCPDQPEDFDGIDDKDGCPEDDADNDGVPDAQDACPKEPGEPSAEPEKNGCPQFIRRVSGSTEIQILQQIQFANARADILPVSFKILDEVVKLLKANPDIKHVDIEGHTDNRGSDKLNEKLSNDRAHSVMKYLVQHGIAEDRLSAAGFGPKRPIAENDTADGRQKNRRVEFHIVDQNKPQSAPTPAPAPKPLPKPAEPIEAPLAPQVEPNE
jgi:outer membrane protein OmpA-like peptidoglycan-associated protein